MITEFIRYFTNELKLIGARILDFLPVLAAAAVVLILTLFLAKLIKNLSIKGFRLLGLNVISQRTGINKIIEPVSKGDGLADLLGSVVYWIIIFLGAAYSLRIIGFDKAQNLFDSIILYIPKIFIALVIFIIGSYLASFIGDIASRTAAAAKISYADSIGTMIRIVIYIIVIMSMIDELALSLDYLKLVAYFITGGVFLTLVIIFGISGIGFGKDFLSGMVLRKYLNSSDIISTKKLKGKVISIDTYCSRLLAGDKKIVVANSLLLREINIYEHREGTDFE